MKHRWIALAAALILAFAAAGCSEREKEPDQGIAGSELVLAPVGRPDYSAYEGELFPIGAWNPTPAMRSYKDEMFSYAKEAGINFLCDLRAAQHPGDRLTKRMEEVRTNGMRTFINLSGYSYERDIAEQYDFLDSDHFMGFNFWDEPGTSRFAELQTSAAAFKGDHPEKLGYINLLPNYASTGQMGADSFSAYIDAFMRDVPSVDHLSYDFYPLVGQMSGGEVMSHGVWQLWLSSLEVMATAAKSSGKDLWVFIQCMSFGNNNRAPQSAADITFQNYINMCFGARAIQYFCLTTPETDEFKEYDVGMLDLDLNPTDNFAYVKEANAELNAFAYVYNRFTWENVMPVYGSADTALNTGAFDMLENALSKSGYFTARADYSALVGKFRDEKGYNGYMIANYSDPMDNQTSNLRMEFNANRLLVCSGGEEKVVEIPDGVYTCALGAGEGQFVVPFNERV